MFEVSSTYPNRYHSNSYIIYKLLLGLWYPVLDIQNFSLLLILTTLVNNLLLCIDTTIVSLVSPPTKKNDKKPIIQVGDMFCSLTSFFQPL